MPGEATRVEIAIIADTHLPRGSRRLPDACVTRLQSAELILHAGDLVSAEALRELEGYGQVVAVHGNVDDAELRTTLPEAVVVEVHGTRIAMIHDAGPARGRLIRLRRRFAAVDAVIFGHSHLPLHERAPDGFQIFNPGSPTERRRAPSRTMGIAHVAAGALRFELVALG
jgi:putative phosphoesterase